MYYSVPWYSTGQYSTVQHTILKHTIIFLRYHKTGNKTSSKRGPRCSPIAFHSDDPGLTVVVYTTNSGESVIGGKARQLTFWCVDNNLSLHSERTKAIIIDFRKNNTDHFPLPINDSNLSWSLKTSRVKTV